MADSIKVHVADGKYTVVLEEGKSHALRYDQPWQPSVDNLVFALASELHETRQYIASTEGFAKDLSDKLAEAAFTAYVKKPIEQFFSAFNQDDVETTYALLCKHPSKDWESVYPNGIEIGVYTTEEKAAEALKNCVGHYPEAWVVCRTTLKQSAEVMRWPVPEPQPEKTDG